MIDTLLAGPRNAGWLAALTLCRRELLRFFRQRDRVIGALGQPLVFWILLGAGLRSSFRPPGGPSYEEYFFPGVLALIVLFTAVFATISIIEDRREGFLQGVLVAPVSRSIVVLGKVLGGTALALIQAWIFLAVAPLAGLSLGFVQILGATLFLAVLGVALTSLGVCLAWQLDSTQGFHAIMSVLLLPLWLLSEALFPAQGAPGWLSLVIACNPLTYAVAGLRRMLYLGEPAPEMCQQLPGLGLCAVVTVGFAAIMFLTATILAGRPSGGTCKPH